MRTPGKLIATACASVALMLAAAPASAAVMFAHFSGTVIAGTGSNPAGLNATYDNSNFFGLGSNLVGANFNATFRYDTDLGLAVTDALTDSRVGGPGFACGLCLSPILDASITVNGITDTFNTSRDGAGNVTINPTGWHQTFFYTAFYQGNIGQALQLYVLNAPNPLLLTTAYTGGNLGNLGPADTYAFATGINLDTGKNYRLALGPMSTTLAPVPEPATWGLMIIGFATTGAMLRSRRRVLARA
jgi:hypothetical protein